MKKVLFTVILILTLGGVASAAPDVSAKSAILIETGGNTVLFEKAPDQELPMASVTKMMTALVVLENKRDLDEMVTVSDTAVRTEGSALYLKPGEKMSISDLLYGLMLESGNDAANVLAEAVAGDNDSFAELMTKRAHELGAVHTVFKNPSGLPAEGHYSTARDLAIIASAALKNSKFAEIVSTEKMTLQPTDQYGTRYLKNHNKLLSIYEGAVGVKTGFTKKAGRCLVSAAERNGVQLVAVTLNAGDDWNDHQKMLDYGFTRVTSAEGAVEFPSAITVTGGLTPTAGITCDLSDAVIVDGKVSVTIELPRFIYAGGTAGEKVGRILLGTGGSVYEFPITLTEDVPQKIVKKSFFDKLFEFFGK